MSRPSRNKAKEKPSHPNTNPKKSGKSVPAMEKVDAVSTELSPTSSPGYAASTDEPSTSQPTLASVLAAIGKLDEDMNTRFNTLDSRLH